VRQVARLARALVHADARTPDRVRIAGPVGRVAAPEAAALEYRDAAPGMALGPLWATWWLAVQARVPDEWDGEQIDLLLVTNSEATLWLDGEPVQGLVSGGRHVRADAMVSAAAAGGEPLSASVEIACNGLFGWSDLHPQPQHGEPPAPPFRLERCELARFDRDAWALSADLDVLAALMDEPRADDAWRGELLRELNRFCNAWDAEDRATWPPARAILVALLQRRNACRTHEITAIGHAHIDTAWLWPLEETYRKCVRTFASQLRLMERYPDYRFACSQAQQYAWIRDREPALWGQIQSAVERGQWLPVGGTWIEPDCNLPAGESLVRQFLYGQRFFEQAFGRRAEVFWNPDVFGYNGQLPQLMRGAGISGFLTQKLSWNRYTTPDHHTFRWVGIDGSSVIAHFPPADTYNAEATVPELRRAARDFKDHERSAQSLLVFGWGDGGGGPTEEMLETLARVADLQGVPRTTIGDPEAFFGELASSEWPEVVGELYFEYHRGTYTSQARTKRASRRAERALHDAELLAAVAGEPAGLEAAWQTLLLNHFHDILPGSSIGEVHARAERDLAEVEAAAGAVRDRLLPRGVVNTIGVGRREVVEGLRFAEAPPCGIGSFVEPRGEVTVDAGESFTLDNGILRAVLGRDGTLRSLVVGGREAMAAPGNVLELYDDRPTDFEAWDLDPFHLETRADCPPATSAEVVLADPLRIEVAFERPIGERSRMR
jgi:alpha-mannosidase